MTNRVMRITAKRQATLPASLCKELGVGPGDSLTVERMRIEGEDVWILRAPKPDWSWAGSLSGYTEDLSHDWKDIEVSIERGWADADRP
jgi:bifunctional DNA-binding transcriptional regulator/antitoxin component of YhaV-PrlF toxin-antitoxin module